MDNPIDKKTEDKIRPDFENYIKNYYCSGAPDLTRCGNGTFETFHYCNKEINTMWWTWVASYNKYSTNNTGV